MTPCQHPQDNHSIDRVRVFHGAPKPLTLCGYHASRLDAAKVIIIFDTKELDN